MWVRITGDVGDITGERAEMTLPVGPVDGVAIRDVSQWDWHGEFSGHDYLVRLSSYDDGWTVHLILRPGELRALKKSLEEFGEVAEDR